MATLLLVRHGQASFLEQNYDKLSPLGEEQARLLGKYWAQRRIKFDRTCVGPRTRQKDTVKLVADGYLEAGLAFPEPLVLSEFDEYQGEEVIRQSLPRLLESDAKISMLHEAFQSASDSGELRVTFQKLFEAVISEWVRGTITLEGVETWPKFCARVNSGLTKFLASGSRGERVAIFTSGGPIAVAMQRALHVSPETTLQVCWMSRNTSWSEFLYATHRFTLSSFNVHSHIEDPTMLSYR